MKVLIIYPNVHNTSRINLGIAYLSACLKKHGHEVKLFDTTFYKEKGEMSDEDFRSKSLQVTDVDLFEQGVTYRHSKFMINDLKSLIQDFKPDILGLNCVDATYNLGKKLLESVQDFKIFTIAGGARVSVDPESVIAEKYVNAICVGEGEETFVELCEKIERGNIESIRNLWIKTKNKVIKSNRRPLIDIDTLPMPDWDIFSDLHLIRPMAGKAYRMGSFDMSRGCPYKCSYCANQFYAELNKGYGNYCRQKNPELLIQEIKHKVQKYNLNFIMFYDDLFPTNEYIDKFCDLYGEIGLPFYVNMRPEVVKEKTVKKLYDVGLCSVGIGVESGDESFRKKILNRNYSNQVVINAFNIMKQFKIRTSSFNIIGSPFETRENIFNTIKLNKEIMPASSTVSYFYPYRGTPLRKTSIEAGFFNPAEEETMDIAHRTGSALIMPQISPEEISFLFMKFQLFVKLPRLFWPLIKYTEKENTIAGYLSKALIEIFNWLNKKNAVWTFPVKKSISSVS